MDYLDTLRSDLDKVIEEAESMTKGEKFTPDDERYKALKTRSVELEKAIKEGAEWRTRKAESDKVGALLRSAENRQKAQAEELKTRAEDPLTVGELFVRSDIFKSYGTSGKTPRVSLDVDLLTRALPYTTTSWAAALTKPAPRDITAPLPPTPLLDLVPTIQWTSEVVTYVTFSKVAGGATVVGEGTAKPSVEFAPTPAEQPMHTIAVYTQATRQLLQNPAGVRSKIDQQLVGDVLREAEVQAQAALTAATLPTATGTDLMRSIRSGIGVVQAAGYQPNAVLLNPADWADLDIEVFFQTNAGTTINTRFWGLQPIASPVQPAGVATVGNFSAGLEHYTRSGVEIYITDSHASTFTSNIFTILAETRDLTVVIRPNAMAECSVTP